MYVRYEWRLHYTTNKKLAERILNIAKTKGQDIFDGRIANLKDTPFRVEEDLYVVELFEIGNSHITDKELSKRFYETIDEIMKIPPSTPAITIFFYTKAPDLSVFRGLYEELYYDEYMNEFGGEGTYLFYKPKTLIRVSYEDYGIPRGRIEIFYIESPSPLDF